MDVCYPPDFRPGEVYPTVLIVQGGGWYRSWKYRLYKEATLFAEQGFISILFDYRTIDDNCATPFDALSDVKSAVRFLKINSKEMQIDPNRIMLFGLSVGGHMAAATAMIDGYNDPEDDLSVSCVPAGMVLLSPVVDNGPTGYVYGKIQEEYKRFSPFYNVRKNLPPIFIIGAENDKLAKSEMLHEFQRKIKDYNNRCELIILKGVNHAVLKSASREQYRDIMRTSVEFFNSI